MAATAFAYTKILTGTYSQVPVNATRRTPMSDGIAKQAKRFNKSYINHSMTYLMTNAQFASFKTWWTTTSSYGALAFDFLNPTTNTTVDGRIPDGVYNANPLNSDWTYWVVEVTIETLE